MKTFAYVDISVTDAELKKCKYYAQTLISNLHALGEQHQTY